MAPLISIDRNTANRHDDLDNYNVDDLSDDPFASPSPPSSAKKRKDAPTSGLGIDEEVAVQKRARVPNVKLDEERHVYFNPNSVDNHPIKAKDESVF